MSKSGCSVDFAENALIPNDTPIFGKFLHNNTTESSEIWRDWSYWLTESYHTSFMWKTCCLELKIEFNNFTVSLRHGWLYKLRNKKYLDRARHPTLPRSTIRDQAHFSAGPTHRVFCHVQRTKFPHLDQRKAHPLNGHLTRGKAFLPSQTTSHPSGNRTTST